MTNVNEPCHVAPLIRGPHSHSYCSDSSMTQPRWSMLCNKSMMHFGPWEENSPLSYYVSSDCHFSMHAPILKTTLSLGLMSASTWLFSSPHLLACKGNVKIYVQMFVVSWDCLFQLSLWVIELTWLVKHLFEWCCLNQAYYYIFTHLFPCKKTGLSHVPERSLNPAVACLKW